MKEDDLKKIVRKKNLQKFYNKLLFMRKNFAKIDYNKIPDEKKNEKLIILRSINSFINNNEILEGVGILYSKNKILRMGTDFVLNVFFNKFSMYMDNPDKIEKI